MGAVDPGLRCSPGCADSIGKGWVLVIEKERVRVLGRTPAGLWRVERIDVARKPTRDVAGTHPGLVPLVGSLTKRGLLAARVADLFGRSG